MYKNYLALHWIDSGYVDVDLCLVELDEIYLMKVEQMLRVAEAASILAEGYGHRVSSIRFRDSHPIILEYDLYSDEIEELIGAVGNELEKTDDMPVIMRLDEDVVRRIPGTEAYVELVVHDDGFICWVGSSDGVVFETPSFLAREVFDWNQEESSNAN